MQSYLFLCTIGPVQSFIAQARKTKDLFNGSKLLSELIKAGIETLPKESAELIFPTQNTGASYPNRFLAELKLSEDPAAFGLEVEAAINKKLIDLGKEILSQQMNGFIKPGVADQSWESFKDRENQQDIPQSYLEQLIKHLEVFWLFLPLEDPLDYASVYENIEQNLGAIKNVRRFQQLDYQNNNLGEQGRKCSVDGERNALFFKKPKEIPAPNSIIRSLNDAIFLDTYQLSRGEGLSAISFLKRFWKIQQHPFESVSGIALTDTLSRLKKLKQEAIYATQTLACLNDQLFYEEFSKEAKQRKKLLEESPSSPNYAQVEENQKTLWDLAHKLNRDTSDTQLVFTPYYALLLFDGDNMGAWLSGNEEFVKKGIDLKTYHKEIAKSLSAFAQEAKQYMHKDNNKKGRIVYAGGDDLMAFVNLNHIFPVLQHLRFLFQEKVQQRLIPFIQAGHEMSFTAGFCIAHVKEPLSIVLHKARKMEKDTKAYFEETGKDGFGIELMKGSGEKHRTFWKFRLSAQKEKNPPSSNLSLMHELCLLLRKGLFSDKFILNLERTYSPLANNGYLELQAALVESDLKRLIWRSFQGELSLKEKECTLLFLAIKSLHEQSPHQWGNFISALHILNFVENELNYPYED